MVYDVNTFMNLWSRSPWTPSPQPPSRYTVYAAYTFTANLVSQVIVYVVNTFLNLWYRSPLETLVPSPLPGIQYTLRTLVLCKISVSSYCLRHENLPKSLIPLSPGNPRPYTPSRYTPYIQYTLHVHLYCKLSVSGYCVRRVHIRSCNPSVFTLPSPCF